MFGQTDNGYTLDAVSQRVSVLSDGEACKLDGAQVTKAGSRLRFAAGWLCKDHAKDYRIVLDGLKLLDPTHKHRAKLDDGKRLVKETLTPDNPVLMFTQRTSGKFKPFGQKPALKPTELATEPPPKKLPEAEGGLSWWLFFGWGVGLFAVLGILIVRGRSRSS